MQSDLSKTYQAPSCGPWGITLDDQLRTQSRLNASFSQNAWANAQLDGCLPRPCNPLPSWPPPTNTFIYPTLEKKEQELLDLGVATGCPAVYAQEPPFAEPKFVGPPRGPVLDLVNPSECPPDGKGGTSCNLGATPDGADPYLAARIASRILNVPLSQVSANMQKYSGPPQPPVLQQPMPGDALPLYGPMAAAVQNNNATGPPMICQPSARWVASPGTPPADKCNLANPEFSVKELVPCTWNTLQGIFYDLQHWKYLPRDSFGGKLGYVLTRDDRSFYLITILVFVGVLFIVFRSLLKHPQPPQRVVPPPHFSAYRPLYYPPPQPYYPPGYGFAVPPPPRM